MIWDFFLGSLFISTLVSVQQLYLSSCVPAIMEEGVNMQCSDHVSGVDYVAYLSWGMTDLVPVGGVSG